MWSAGRGKRIYRKYGDHRDRASACAPTSMTLFRSVGSTLQTRDGPPVTAISKHSSNSCSAGQFALGTCKAHSRGCRLVLPRSTQGVSPSLLTSMSALSSISFNDYQHPLCTSRGGCRGLCHPFRSKWSRKPIKVTPLELLYQMLHGFIVHAQVGAKFHLGRAIALTVLLPGDRMN